MSNSLLTDELSAPLNGATTANLDINTGTSNLIVDNLPEKTQVLASGALHYFEKQGRPTESFSSEPRDMTIAYRLSLAVAVRRY